MTGRQCARIWGGAEEFDADFDAAIGSGTGADDANELFFFSFGILDKNFLTDFPLPMTGRSVPWALFSET